VTFILFYFKRIEFNIQKNEMFYFNHLHELILRVTTDLVLSKVLYLKFVNKKNNINKRFQ